MSRPRTCVVIPAFNEEASLPLVLEAIPSAAVDKVIVVDNNSTDGTAAAADHAGAHVVHESKQGYGAACLRGIAALPESCECVVFLDADYSDHPEELLELVQPIWRCESDLVIGSRLRGEHEPGALLVQARLGNRLACFLMRWLWGYRFTDLGPFRAIRTAALRDLGMRDETFGWTVEMQVRALQMGLRVCEVPVRYRRRVGVSKITGTVKGTVLAGYKILTTIAALRLRYGAPYDYGRDGASPRRR